MSCSDPELAKRVLEQGADDPAWSAHVSACAGCRRVTARLCALTSGAVAVESEAHPGADALVAFDEGDASLGVDERRLIAEHLAGCDDCAAALRAVPAEAATESTPQRRRFWPVAAAAGWLVASALGWRTFDAPSQMRAATDPILIAEDVVLSAARGGTSESSPLAGAKGSLLRIHLILGEDVLPGATLRLAITGKDAGTELRFDVRVVELDEWARPIVLLLPERLPPRPCSVRVTTPTGRLVDFLLR